MASSPVQARFSLVSDADGCRLVVTLPWSADLSVNHLYGRSGGRTFLKDPPRAWRAALAWNVRAHYHRLRRCPRITVSWRAWAPDHRRRDVSNLSKVILDGVADGLDLDDSVFSTGEVEPIQVDVERPRIEVTVQGSHQ